MRRRLSFLLLTLAVVTLPACGPQDPNVVPVLPQTHVAKYGGDVMASVLVIAEQAAALHEAGILKTPDAAHTMIVANKMGVLGLKLSQGLTLYDQATIVADRIKAKAGLDVVLAELETLLGNVIPVPIPAKIAEAIAVIQKTISLIRAALLVPAPA